jgi:quinolinate synthase
MDNLRRHLQAGTDGEKPNRIESENLIHEINRLRKEKNAVILAHYYQRKDVQEIADYIGDSLGLSQHALKTSSKIIVFAGVHFMAETAKILNPGKRVFLPDLRSGCSLADSCTAKSLMIAKSLYPKHKVVSYINCSAEVKALSDIICTSANAEKVIRSIPEDQPILFVPDRNLGKYLQHVTGRRMLIWDGVCTVHENFSIDKIIQIHLENPDSVLVAHPESEPAILRAANYIGSTTGMINFAMNDPHGCFIVATEAGILCQMEKEVPHKKFIAAPIFTDNTCACSECSFMKYTSLENILQCLRDEVFEITVPDDIARRALLPIRRMLDLSS